ncbi:hypothetical protein FSP39_013029 [Pinctada imbricata]|uniref:Transporter n=1 Tax=Pinctada imbricata TaxID=66713 RepID=A0AA89BLZ3_PINIB|nr:hypothetical protein FSP39_013029 [Pinctada imbricata]
MRKNGNDDNTKKEDATDHLDPVEHVEMEADLHSDSENTSQDDGEDYQRGTWSRKTDFILSVVGYSVGVSNIWRFPYLCMKNGGGAFLIPFFFFLIFCGIPLFFLELCIGQFSGVSSIFVWRICPLFQGLGYLMVIVSFLMSWYYITVLVWVLYFLYNSFFSPLPWSVCTNDWNTIYCIKTRQKINGNLSDYNGTVAALTTNGTISGTWNQTADLNSWNASWSGLAVNQTTTESMINHSQLRTAAKEFWQYEVLRLSGGLDEPGSIQLHLFICLLLAWILVFFCLMKGVKSVGKVVYITAVLPYILLTTFLIRGLMLPGSLDGIKYYLIPDWAKLLDYQVWLEAGIQVFYSLGPAWGGLITMSSYNKFHNNCLRDALVGSLADGLTSFYAGFVIFAVLGYMAEEAGLTIKEVADSGPGLALVAYPEAITKLPYPQVWAVMFFLMLLTLGIDSQFGTFETVSSGLVDAFPKQLGKRKVLLTAMLCTAMFIIGLPFTTNGGMYLFQLVDWYAASLCVLITCFLECIIVGWIYGAERFSRDVELMLGRPVWLIFRICWCIITPLVMLVAFIITLTQYQPPTYEDYTYPGFARALGVILSFIPLIPLPVTMVYLLVKTEGSLWERLRLLTAPSPDWGPHINKYKKSYHSEKNCLDTQPFLIQAQHNILGSWVKPR